MDDFLKAKPKLNLKSNDQPTPRITQPTADEDYFEESDPPIQDGHEALDLSNDDSAELTVDDMPVMSTTPETSTKTKKRKNPKEWFLSLSKKQKIIFCFTIVAIVLISIGAVVFMQKNEKSADTPAQQSTRQTTKPKTEASKLTGLQISPELNKRSVTGVMIENSQEARPQSGLLEAGVIYEAIAEGGITRFLALYQEGKPDYIGPIRSVRPYYVDWVQGFDASLVHVGGSDQGKNKIKTDGVKDIDQSYNSTYFERVDTRDAPHDVYSSANKLDELQKAKNFTNSEFTGFTRKKEDTTKTPAAINIHLSISSPLFNVDYKYDTKTNSYSRSVGGEPHTDEKSGKQLSPKVVIALVMQQGYDAGYTTYNSLGSGHCYIFQDGQVTEGTWIKANSKDQTTFKDERGEEIKLNPGQTWISLVGTSGAVTHSL
ncbi:DUF3048 domain-containing protein [Candidatus Saccharibacteria bacterium]|nr:DUF3048 domain-containing protein [Candidatus Saccharibacteria bacterium]